MIIITEQAQQKIKKSLTERQKGKGIRIGVKTTGCSGLSYVLEYIDETTSDHEPFLFDGFTAYIDKRHKVYFTGMTIDYIKQGLNEGFDFINPNEAARCGCGASFTVKQ